MILDAQTRQFAPITFSIGSTFSDNILEGQEKFALRISQSNSFQVGQNGSVEIQIHDATGMWSLSKSLTCNWKSYPSSNVTFFCFLCM